MRKTALLVVAAGLAAAAGVAAWHLIYAVIFWFALSWETFSIALVAWLPLVPGFAAGLVWGVGGGRAPRPKPMLLILAIATAILIPMWVAELVPQVKQWLLDIRFPVRGLPQVPSLIVVNAWTLWLGVLAARRSGGRAAPVRMVGVALLLAVILGGASLWRERLFPEYGIWHLLDRYETARVNRSYADAVACFTPEYAERELGSPPSVSKYRAACQREQASLGATEETRFCFDAPTTYERVAGTDAREVTIRYNYQTLDELGVVPWTWHFTIEPRGRTWRIADMRPDAEEVRSYRSALKFTFGPAGTVRLLSAPKELQQRPPMRDRSPLSIGR